MGFSVEFPLEEKRRVKVCGFVFWFLVNKRREKEVKRMGKSVDCVEWTKEQNKQRTDKQTNGQIKKRDNSVTMRDK